MASHVCLFAAILNFGVNCLSLPHLHGLSLEPIILPEAMQDTMPSMAAVMAARFWRGVILVVYVLRSSWWGFARARAQEGITQLGANQLL